ncbi:MAG TPA: NAD-dependent epimerase/dehydratase family protein [Methyloceanibacter sp.]|jgi:nucleoside-diphosphate-sugar epimerase|nr:NAD-dependent epimerase/dehydratase family protein [Methyloceanibacter sp.]
MGQASPKAQKASAKPLVALTGATGFIGQYLLRELPKRGYRLRVLLRRPTMLPEGCASAVIGDLAKPYNMAEALSGVDAVIHSAGIASTMSGLPEDDYRLFNTEATVKFARASERARVKRFVFLSSIRAQSGPTAEGVLTEESTPQPTDAYGRSKLAAEQGLAETALDWVALRLALVYGPGVEGNMARLIKLARSPYPLPLAGLKAEHSLLALDNLVEAVDKVLAAQEPLKRPLIVADPKPLTLGGIIAAMRQGLGRRAALFYVPKPLLKTALRAAGHSEGYEPLFGSLVADPSALARLNWVPRVDTTAGLAALVRKSSV